MPVRPQDGAARACNAPPEKTAPLPELPALVLAARQRAVRYDHARLSAIVRSALPDCVAVSIRLGGPLSSIRTVECSVVGSRTMAKIHRDFLGERGATDVITFPYGEIVVCATVAASRAPEFGHPVADELALYCIHGLLHLAGLDDAAPSDADRMRREQKRILKAAAMAQRPPNGKKTNKEWPQHDQ